MDTSITDYLNTLEFPKLVNEADEEACFKNFQKDYAFLLKSFQLNLNPLLDKPDANQYLITALLKTLAERESLLRHDINQMLPLLLPTPVASNSLTTKTLQLDAIIALFGMKRESKDGNKNLLESDDAIKKRLQSRFSILSKTGTQNSYIYSFLSLDPSIQDITILQDENEAGKLQIFLLPKVKLIKKEEKKLKIKPTNLKKGFQSLDNWITALKPSLVEAISKKDIIPLRDTYVLHSGKLRNVNVIININEENENAETINKVVTIAKDYFNRKYKFNAVISESELFSYFDYTYSEKLTIAFNNEEEKKVSSIDCDKNQAPFLQQLMINKQIYKTIILATSNNG